MRLERLLRPRPRPGEHAGGGGPAEPLPQHVTLPLLALVTEQSMDQDYQHVARRRAEQGAPDEQEQGRAAEQRRRQRLASGAVVGVFGLLVAVAAVQTSRNADVDALSRASLVSRVQEEREAVRQLQDRAGELRAANTEAEAEARELREAADEVNQRVSRLGVRTGYLAVRGPGLRITVDSAPDALKDDVFKDTDLRYLVDGLWAAGAEAIAINGQRLTALSPIQNSGGAIHVNVRPLSPPYVVSAIGDPDTLEARLLRTTHGQVFYGVARSLEFDLRVEDDDDLELPAARARRLLYADEYTPAQPGRMKEMGP